MKTNLAPKHIRKIADTNLLWFKISNKYLVVSDNVWVLIDLLLKAETPHSFALALKQTLNIEAQEASVYFEEITSLLIDSNAVQNSSITSLVTTTVPKMTRVNYYKFATTTVKIHFETAVIQSIIHPPIAHHQIDNDSKFDTSFSIYKTNNQLYLLKDNQYIAHFKTEDFHFIQGRFAMELTNTIHKKTIENWVATFHASTVTNGQQSIMIIGDSGNGKSTLSALLMAHGFDLLADDFTPMYTDLNLYRYPNAISIKKGAFPIVDASIPGFNTLKTYSSGAKKVAIKYLPQNNNATHMVSHFPCKTIVRVKYNETAPSRLQPISIENILETLIPDSWLSPNDEHALKFMDWISGINCFELSYNDNNFAINTFNELFKQQ